MRDTTQQGNLGRTARAIGMELPVRRAPVRRRTGQAALFRSGWYGIEAATTQLAPPSPIEVPAPVRAPSGEPPPAENPVPVVQPPGATPTTASAGVQV